MKVAMCVRFVDGNLRFSDKLGNSDKFLVYDLENEKLFDKFTNHFKNSPSSEIFCAQILIKRGVNAIVCGKCENNAKNLFTEANIEVVENVGMRPTDFVEILYAKFRQNSRINV